MATSASTSGADDDNNEGSAVSTFVSSLVFNLVVAAAIFIAFCILRSRFKRVYSPRTYAVSPEKRSPAISDGPLAWIFAVLSVSDEEIIKRVGLDTYMFLRYMRAMFIIFVVLSFLSAVTILPVNITGGGDAKGMDVLTMGNVKPESSKLWVHIVFFIVFVSWVLWVIFGELKIYTRLRIWWLTNPAHAEKVGASTVLVSTLPDSLIDDDNKLNSMFGIYPGGVRQVVVNRNCSELEDIVEERDNCVGKLEKLLTNYAVQCQKAHNKATKKGTTYKEPKRPTTRVSKIPFKGPKVDAIEHFSTQIAKLNHQIGEVDGDESKFKRQSSAFVLFRKQIAAHMAAQTVLDYIPFSMDSVSLDINADDIIWKNLNMNPYDRRIRSYISLAITIGLVVVWTILTGFLTALVSVKNLKSLPGLGGMTDSEFFGIFTGIVPAVLLAVVMMLLPIILRLLLRLEGTLRESEVNLRLLNRFYFFQVWNVYLVMIFSTGIIIVATKSFNDLSKIPDMISKDVPKAGLTALTYVLLLAFVGAAKEILQIARLALRYILPMLFAKTPRAISNSETPAAFDWGTSIPIHSLIFLMGFSYSFIAPIVNWFTAVYFGLFYLVYRYQFLYVYNDANWVTGGLSFPKSITQTFVGVYVSEVFLLLMMVAKVIAAETVTANGIVRVVFTGLILLATIAAHRYINHAYMPIINYLPIRGAAEIEANPKIAQKFPDVTGSGEIDANDILETDSATEAQNKIRRRIYATYGSLVPKSLIDFVLRKIPSLLSPKRIISFGDKANNSGNSPTDVGTSSGGHSHHDEEAAADSGALLPMPVPQHYSSNNTTEEEKKTEGVDDGHSNIISIDSSSQQHMTMPMPAAADDNMLNVPFDSHQASSPPETRDGVGAQSIHSYTSETELRRRQRHNSNTSQSKRRSRFEQSTDNLVMSQVGDNALSEVFSNPALRAKPVSLVWVPMDQNRLCADLYENVKEWGNGTVRVVTEGTKINDRCKVQVDMDYDIEEEYEKVSSSK